MYSNHYKYLNFMLHYSNISLRRDMRNIGERVSTRMSDRDEKSRDTNDIKLVDVLI